MPPIRFAVTGASGRLGRELVCRWGGAPINSNILDVDKLAKEIKDISPNIIVHCAAYTDVDKCQTRDWHKAHASIVKGTRNLISVTNLPIFYLSTDYVFTGYNGPYNEDDEPCPINIYGVLKHKGELLCRQNLDTIIRTTLLYGGHKPDFVSWVLDQLSKGKEFGVYDDLRGSPTHVHYLAQGIIALINFSNRPHTINIAGNTVLSRYEWACRIADKFDYNSDLIYPILYDNPKVPRPKKAGLITFYAQSRGIPIYDLEHGLTKMYKDKNEHENIPNHSLL